MLNKLYSLMLRYSFKPNNKYDQNFIINENIIKKLIEILEPKKEEIILEIGPGVGFLTNELLKNYKKVIAIEKDKKMIEILEKEFYKEIKDNKLELINKDILLVNLNNLKYNKIVSFVPYSISQKIIYKIKNKCTSILILQKEFCDKLVAIEGFENYNAISIITQIYNKIKLHTKISKNSFFPKPKCESRIIELIPKNTQYSSKLNLFIKEIFRYSNKNLLKAIKLSNSILKLDLNIVENKLDLNLKKKKVKLLNIKEIKKIYNLIYNK